MKTIFKSIFFIALSTLFFGSCAKNDDFSVPTLNCEDPKVTINKTIDELYLLAEQTVKPYSGDPKDILEGVVVSSDQGGNFHNKLHILDKETKKPLVLNIENSASFVQYPPGTVIYVRLGGLYFNNSYDLLNVGGGTNGKYTTTIPKGSINKFVGKFCTPIKDFNDYNPIITLEELNSKKEFYKGKLVTIKDVQFNRNLIGKKLYDKSDVDSQGQTLREMVDKDGRTFFIRTSQYSRDFVAYEITKYSGSITGIVDVFSNNVQFYPRVLDDINLKDQPFGDGGVDPEPEDITLGKFLAFPGADFEDWDAFLGVIFKNQLSDATAKKAPNKGWENSTGLAVEGQRDKNGYLFSVEKVKMPTDATKLSFLVKGTSAKSLSINIHKANGTNYYAYNLENVTTSKVIQPNMEETSFDGVPSGNTTNVYTGTIDTGGNWVKITLDLGALNGDYHKTGTGTFISFRNGNKANYDLVIDEIRFEDGTPVDDNGEGPVDPEPGEPFIVADFNAWDGFVGTLNNFGLKPYATHAPGQGRDGKDALKLSGTTTANDYVFTITNKEVPAGKTKVVIWVKGTSDKKSLSFNVNKAAGGFDPFNAGVIETTDLNLSKFTSNQYTGTIDTGGNWVKLTLDLTETEYNTTGTGDVFALKTGSGSTYELLIDSIYFE